MIHIKQTKAFTMLEVIMVIIVLGIIASLAMPRLERDFKQEAADDILSQIRYTQHLALIDDMHEFDDPKWQRKFWKIMFFDCAGDQYYMIGSDSNGDGGAVGLFTKTEAAIDPVNNKPMFNSCAVTDKSAFSPRIFLSKKYDITNVTASSSCSTNNGASNKHIGFDHLGRPHYGFSTSLAPNYASYMTQACVMTFTLSDNSTFKINIAPETGYAHIVNQDDS